MSSDAEEKIEEQKNVLRLTTSMALREFRLNGIDTDISIVCKDREELKAHSLILSAGSPYFKQMFRGKFKESETKRVDFPTIETSTMTAVLDFIYVSSSQYLKEKGPEELVKIIETAHLLDLKMLVEDCWNLLIQQVNSGNCLMIWEKSLLYNERISEIETLLAKFMPDIVKTDAFTNLTFSHVTKLLEIMNKNATTEDYLLEAVLNWYRMNKEDATALLELLLYFNFDFLSEKYVDRILQEEQIVTENRLIKKFFELQIKPKLKGENLIKTNFSTNVSIFKFRIGHYFQNNDDHNTCKLALKIIQIFPVVGEESMLILPIERGKVIDCFHWKSEIYFLIQNQHDKSQYLVGYDWQKQNIILSNKVWVPLAFTECLATRNKIFIIGTPISVGYETAFELNKLLLSCFGKDGSNSSTEFEIQKKNFYLNIFENLYILYQTRFSDCFYCFNIMLSNASTFVTSQSFELPKDVSKVMVATYDKGIYLFFPDEETLTVYEFVENKWNIFTVECFKWEPMYKCYSTNSTKCIFYSYWGNFFTFDFLTREFKHLDLKIPQFKNKKEFVQLELGRNDVFINF